MNKRRFNRRHSDKNRIDGKIDTGMWMQYIEQIQGMSRQLGKMSDTQQLPAMSRQMDKLAELIIKEVNRSMRIKDE